MMTVELVINDGGRMVPLTLGVSQILVRNGDGTPIMVAADFGTLRSQMVSKIGDDDFIPTLVQLGVNETVICDRLEMPKPPQGARLISGPKKK